MAQNGDYVNLARRGDGLYSLTRNGAKRFGLASSRGAGIVRNLLSGRLPRPLTLAMGGVNGDEAEESASASES